MRRNLSLLVVCTAVSMLVACGKAAEKPAAPAAPSASTATAPAATSEPAAPAAGSTMMAATDTIGVPECDNYVKKYMECVGAKVPEVARAQYKASFDAMVASWKQIAATADGKAGLATACSQATAAAAQAMTAYGCAF